ncbi:hypothetical protein N5079_12405 [Planotetraspora sp. A-T 1434]|uniref:hypothetical protein n=1 Tax=Planotetraspora sp. A-T 1434 TaxID=2979219 RepID=UPI0021C0B535|nr:hypothetical protein [Planotetraspora sp. A-T 1434]MCT9931020.1 hypothetical protein [Planotetraspora sp. A-T 1434]
MVVTVATVVTSGYFAVSGLVDPGGLVPGGDAPAARTYAGYMAARGVVLLGAALWFAVARAWRPLRLVLALNAVVQSLDAGLGAARQEVAQTVGPAVFAAALFAAAVALGRATESRDAVLAAESAHLGER